MAKIFDKMKDLMFGEYEDDDDYYEDDYTAAPAPVRETSSYGLRDASADYSAPVASTSRKSSSRNNANPQIYSVNTNVTMQVVIIKPECYEDAQEICDQIKTKRPVVVNLEKVEYPVAQRIMDFLSGTCYALEGSIQRVANNIFIIAPENVDISGDFKEELKTKGVLLPWMNGSSNAR
ncbi:MAG: cell division protein SepF [Anaerotignum sp.]|nr:cell division protein SepF [Anaerotignum sp.]